MTTHTDTSKLAGYTAKDFPSLGSEQKYLTGEFAKIELAVQNIVAVMKLFEARMNSNGLT